MDDVLRIQRDIVRSYEDDMVKYAEKKDKSRIKECFQSIPRQLAKENKKFQYSVVKKGSTSAKYAGSLQWIEDAGDVYKRQDDDFVDAIKEIINGQHMCAEYAVKKAGDNQAAVFAAMDDPYLQARSADVIDIAQALSLIHI